MPRRRRFSGLPLVVGLAGCLGLATACQAPNGQALHRLACEQAAASLNLQSVAQMDVLRKALGVAPDVDPIGTCRALGVNMNQQQEASPPGEAEPSESQ